MIIVETCPVCGNDIQTVVKCSYPPILAKECYRCGWHWEGTKGEIIRVPFADPHKHEVKLDGTEELA